MHESPVQNVFEKLSNHNLGWTKNHFSGGTQKSSVGIKNT